MNLNQKAACLIPQNCQWRLSQKRKTHLNHLTCLKKLTFASGEYNLISLTATILTVAMQATVATAGVGVRYTWCLGVQICVLLSGTNLKFHQPSYPSDSLRECCQRPSDHSSLAVSKCFFFPKSQNFTDINPKTPRFEWIKRVYPHAVKP